MKFPREPKRYITRSQMSRLAEDRLILLAMAVVILVLLLIGLSEWGPTAPPAEPAPASEPPATSAIGWPAPAPPAVAAPLEPPAAAEYAEVDWYLTHSEAVCVALVVWAEARGEPLEGKLAVADVVLNRQRGDELPCDVIRKVDQFAVAGHAGVPRPIGGEPAWRDSLFAATAALRDRGADPRPIDAHVDRTGGARCMVSPAHMPADRDRWPSWAQGKPITTVGGHAFFDCRQPRPKRLAGV